MKSLYKLRSRNLAENRKSFKNILIYFFLYSFNLVSITNKAITKITPVSTALTEVNTSNYLIPLVGTITTLVSTALVTNVKTKVVFKSLGSKKFHRQTR